MECIELFCFAIGPQPAVETVITTVVTEYSLSHALNGQFTVTINGRS